MTRRRIKHEQIPSESKRNATLGKRADGLLKKATELSILCGVEVGVIVHKGGGENNSILWPSPTVFTQRLQKFLDFPNSERAKRMLTHEKYMEQTLNSETQNLMKMRKRNEVKESRQLMNDVVRGKSCFDELDLYQLNGLNSVADEMLKKLGKRDNELNYKGQQEVQLLPPPSLLENLMNDKWFIETMSEEQDVSCRFLGVSAEIGGAASSAGVDDDSVL